MGTLKVVVVDDHQLMLEAVELALGDDDIEIVGVARSGAQALPVIARTQPDIVLLDLRMPDMDGLTCLELIRQRFPSVKVVMLSGAEEPELIEACLRRGASAFVMKHVDPRDLAAALRQAAEGTVFQPFAGIGRDTGGAAREAGLTEKQREILHALVQGLSNKQIAQQLWLSEQTVKFHLTNIYRTLGVANRTEAAHRAIRDGLVDNPVSERSA